MTTPESPRTKEQVLADIGEFVTRVQITFDRLTGLDDAQQREARILAKELPIYTNLLVELTSFVGPEEALRLTEGKRLSRKWLYRSGEHGGTEVTILNESPIVFKGLLERAARTENKEAIKEAPRVEELRREAGAEARDVTTH